MRELSKDYSTVQNIASAIKAITGIDVTIVDSGFIRIGGTGKYKDLINSEVPANSVYGIILQTGKPLIIEEPKKDQLCYNCPHIKNCSECASVGYPIKDEDGRVMGVIGLIAFNPDQRKELLTKKNQFLNFLEHMAGLLQSKISATRLMDRLREEKNEIDAIINCLDRGVLTLNSEGIIKHINKKACKILSIKENEATGRNIKSIVSSVELPQAKLDKNLEMRGRWKIQGTGKEVEVIYSVTPINIGIKKCGFVYTFERAEDINTLAYNLSISSVQNYTFDDIIGNSIEITRVKEAARKAAVSEATILLRGESGTGKELFARAIHSASPRRGKKFVAINCSAIPEDLLESELFGYEGGAFTGAETGGKIGKFEYASGGTIFLDEIGDMPLHLQPKLLRVLQERQIVRIGGQTPVPVDVRVLAATNQNLEELINKKQFREDLFYRLNVIPINIPPLRERLDDLLPCARYFIRKYSRKLGIDVRELSGDVISLFFNYSWPGNIRELENTIEYCVTMARSRVITMEDLPQHLLAYSFNQELSLEARLERCEKDIIKKMLQKYGYSTDGKKEVATRLGISLATLYRKIKKMKIQDENYSQT